MPFLRQSTSQVIRFGPCLDKTDGVTEETGLTLAQADMRLSKDGAAFAQKSAAGNATHDSDGWYSTTLSTTDTGTVGELRLNVHQPANMLPVWDRWWVIEEAVYDAMYGASAAGPLQSTVAARKLNVASTGDADVDVQLWRGSIPNGLTSGDLQVDVNRIKTGTNSPNILNLWLDIAVDGGADSGTTTTLVDAALTEADDFWNNSLLIIITGTNKGHTAVVTDFVAATDTLTFTPAAPAGITTEAYVLIPGLGLSSVQAWLGTAVTLGNSAPDVNIASTDDIDLSATQKASVNTEVDTALRTTTDAEPSSVPAATATIVDKLGWLMALARNKGTQTSTTKTLRNDADGADIATSAISDDGTTFTRGEWS